MALRAISTKKLTTYSIQLLRSTLPNPKGIHEVGSSNISGMDEVKAIITLRSGKEVDQPMPKPVEDSSREKNCNLSIFS